MPHSFTDTTGHTWPIAITIGAAKRVRSLLDLDLLNLEAGQPPTIQRLHDLATVLDVVFALVKPDADALGVSDEDFAGRLDGKAAGAARAALWAGLTDFFLDAGRQDAARLLTRSNAVIEAEIAANRSALDDPAIDAAIDEALARKVDQARAAIRRAMPTPGPSSPNTPPSSG